MAPDHRTQSRAFAWRTYEVAGLGANAAYQVVQVLLNLLWPGNVPSAIDSTWMLDELGPAGWATAKCVFAALLLVAIPLSNRALEQEGTLMWRRVAPLPADS